LKNIFKCPLFYLRNIFVYTILHLKNYTFTLQCSQTGSSHLLSFWHITMMLLQPVIFPANLKGSAEVTSVSNYH